MYCVLAGYGYGLVSLMVRVRVASWGFDLSARVCIQDILTSRAWPSGCFVQPLGRVRASKGILHTTSEPSRERVKVSHVICNSRVYNN